MQPWTPCGVCSTRQVQEFYVRSLGRHGNTISLEARATPPTSDSLMPRSLPFGQAEPRRYTFRA